MNLSNTPGKPSRGLRGASLALALALGVASLAAPTDFKIPAQPAADALLAFSKQASTEVVFPFDELKQRRAVAVEGRIEPAEALNRLLAGTGYAALLEANGKWTVKKSSRQNSVEPSELPKEETVRRVDSPRAPAEAKREEAEAVQLEAMTVTGSNIRRVDAETALPVTVIDRAEIELRGFSTMAELFESLTIAEPSAIVESSFNAQGARGDIGTVDLRGLGTGSTLTLVNGRRVAPFPIKTSENGTFSLTSNINSIPSSLVSRVEILRDGASAIYGADAAAGVINNLISRTYEGRTLRARMAMTQHGGANEYAFTTTAGFKQGKTHLSVAFDYFHRDTLTALDRSWSKDANLQLTHGLPAPWNGLPLVDANGVTVRDNDLNNRQAINRYGVWQRGFLQPDDSFVGSRPTGNAGIVTGTTPTVDATMNATGTFTYWQTAAGALVWKQSAATVDRDSPENIAYTNVNTWRGFLPRTDRFQLSTFFDRPLTARTELFGDVMLYRAASHSAYEPVNFNFADGVNMVVPVNNPWNPFGSRFYEINGAPNPDGTPRLRGAPAELRATTAVRLDQLRPRPFDTLTHQFRVLGGLRGRFADGWEWESGLTYSGAQTHVYDHDTMRESQVRLALARTDASAYNPFGYSFKIVNAAIQVDRPYLNPDAVMNPLYTTAEQYGASKLFVWDAKVNGHLWQIFQGGRVGVASGAEVRWEAYTEKRPAFHGLNPPQSVNPPLLRAFDNDIINSSANDEIDAQQSIYAGYAEVSLPFVTRANRLPFIEGLELTLAGRFEHFSIHGQAVKPKASLVWSPASWLKLRGSYNESFRAPNLVLTNITPVVRYISSTDQYRFAISNDVTADGAQLRRTQTLGNRSIRPEKAQSWVAGFVLDAPVVRGLSATFDYWRINQNDAFSSESAASNLVQDQLLLTLATQAELAKGTPVDQIDLGSGTTNYQGYKVTRLPVSADDRALFAAYNARQPTNASKRAAVGRFVQTSTSVINLGGNDLEGYDVGLQYRLPTNRAGRFVLRGEATHYLRRTSQTGPTSPVLSSLGLNGRAEWRANLSLSWRRGGWSGNWFSTYFGSFASSGAATTKAVYDVLGGPGYISVFNNNGVTQYLLRVEPTIAHNANLAYRFPTGAQAWLRDVTVRCGINNVFDKEPPVTDNQVGYQSGTVNIRGRQFTLEFEKKF